MICITGYRFPNDIPDGTYRYIGTVRIVRKRIVILGGNRKCN